MTLRRICTYDRGVVIMDDDEYLRTVQRFLRVLILVAETNGLAPDPIVMHAKIEGAGLLTRQRALCALIRLAKDNGLNGNTDVSASDPRARAKLSHRLAEGERPCVTKLLISTPAMSTCKLGPIIILQPRGDLISGCHNAAGARLKLSNCRPNSEGGVLPNIVGEPSVKRAS